ncbi:basic proline-rich protein-like [Eublepharis macularius]|uniref:Basic proline-rich protein-like n=1 Tax=Eublepharis macularius TaxID=481883 RepID=A0AA97K8Q0_EUBMA|nr:basic proline-rich protein-like [Eublepharis macularius]
MRSAWPLSPPPPSGEARPCAAGLASAPGHLHPGPTPQLLGQAPQETEGGTLRPPAGKQPLQRPPGRDPSQPPPPGSEPGPPPPPPQACPAGVALRPRAPLPTPRSGAKLCPARPEGQPDPPPPPSSPGRPRSAGGAPGRARPGQGGGRPGAAGRGERGRLPAGERLEVAAQDGGFSPRHSCSQLLGPGRLALAPRSGSAAAFSPASPPPPPPPPLTSSLAGPGPASCAARPAGSAASAGRHLPPRSAPRPGGSERPRHAHAQPLDTTRGTCARGHLGPGSRAHLPGPS